MINAAIFSYSRGDDDSINCLSVSMVKEKQPRNLLKIAKEKLKCCEEFSEAMIYYVLDDIEYIVRIERLEV